MIEGSMGMAWKLKRKGGRQGKWRTWRATNVLWEKEARNGGGRQLTYDNISLLLLDRIEKLETRVGELEVANDMRAREHAMLRKELTQLFRAESVELTERRSGMIDALFELLTTTTTPLISFTDASKRLGCSKSYLKKIKPLILKDLRFRIVELPNKHKKMHFITLAGYQGRQRGMKETIPAQNPDDLFEAKADSILDQLNAAGRDDPIPKTIGIRSIGHTGHVSVSSQREI